MNILYAQSPALFWCALALIVCFFVRRGAHRVRAVLDLVLGLLCVVGGVALYYLGMYDEYFTIRDFFLIRTAGWIGRPPGRAGRKDPAEGAGGRQDPGLYRRAGGRQGRRPGGGKRVRRRGRPGERVRKKRVCCGTPVCPRQKGFLTS